MTLGSGGVIYSGAGNSAISGTGTLTGLTNNEDVVFHVANGSLDVAVSLNGIDSNGLVGNGGVTKAGAGTLFLRAPNTFLGPVNINSGTLAIVGPGGTVHPAVLGATGASRNINLNGGTFRVLGDFDPGASSMQVVVGSSGGAIRMSYGGTIILNDANQFQGVGDLLLTGGGRYTISQATIGYTGFGGNVTVDGGVLNLLNINAIGGRAEQVITLKPGSALINRIGSGVGVPGLPNDLVLEGGTELYVQGGNRQYSGDIQLSGTNTIALVERDAVQQDRQMFLTGRVSGSGITLKQRRSALSKQRIQRADGNHYFESERSAGSPCARLAGHDLGRRDDRHGRQLASSSSALPERRLQSGRCAEQSR